MPGRRGAIADSIQALTAQLRADLTHVWDRIAASVAALEADWPTTGPAARRAMLLRLQAHIAALADAADEIAARHVLAGVRDAYLLGGHATALTVGAAALSSTGVDLEAITVLAGDTHADLLAATTHIRASTKDLIRTLARDHVADRLYTGQTAVQAGRDLAKALQAKSVSAIVYKDGSRHGLAEYSEMVLRTKTAEAYQVGGFNQAAGFKVKYVEVMDGPGCGWTSHDDTQLANGMILTLDAARAYPTSHPNCRRVTMARPDVKSLDGATPIGPQFTSAQLAAALENGGEVSFPRVGRRANGTTASPAAAGPAAARRASPGAAAARRAALLARRAS